MWSTAEHQVSRQDVKYPKMSFCRLLFFFCCFSIDRCVCVSYYGYRDVNSAHITHDVTASCVVLSFPHKHNFYIFMVRITEKVKIYVYEHFLKITTQQRDKQRETSSSLKYLIINISHNSPSHTWILRLHTVTWWCHIFDSWQNIWGARNKQTKQCTLFKVHLLLITEED